MSLLNRFREIFVPADNLAVVSPENALYSPEGEFIRVYSRRRDAIRGAKRRGWEVA